MADELSLSKAFLASARERANGILGQTHIGADTISTVRDLLKSIESLEAQLQGSEGQGADVRLARKRAEQSRAEARAAEAKAAAAEAKAEAARNLIFSLVEEFKGVNSEVNAILKRHPSDSTDPDAVSANKMKAAIQRMSSVFAKSAVGNKS